MEEKYVIKALAALAQPNRLQIFRLLVVKGAEGLTPALIAEGIIGGLGSTGGALIGALLVGLMANYTGFLAPKLALFSNIALMAAILLWRPQGVFPVVNR